jgi:pyruvate,orthophosphate dikinase
VPYVIKTKNDIKLANRFGEGRNEPTSPEESGGKGWGLTQMVEEGIPVPPGFTLTTDACLRIADPTFASHLRFQVKREYLALAQHLGYAPLVSVRSGARRSMPGMMDTILNVGCTDASLPGLIERLGEKTATDCYRRLVVMYGEVVHGIKYGPHAESLESAKAHYLAITGEQFPQDLMTQLTTSIEAVFRSWSNERAVDYRNDAIKCGDLPPDCHKWGTACNVQTMVFGNRGADSGSGVLFTRDCATGAAEFVAEFLVDAQGEEVVAGTRTPLPISEMPKQGAAWSKAHAKLLDIAEQMELDRREAQDIEFTVELGKLWILQTRAAKRTGLAAIKIARDFVKDGIITKDEAFARLSARDFAAAQAPQLSPKSKKKVYFTGIGACPGVATGKVAKSAKAAIKMAKQGPVVLVTEDTTPDDLAGMLVSAGVLTAVGGKTSHAAVVAREKNIPTVCGAGFKQDYFVEGELVSIDGTTGKVYQGKVTTVDGSQNEALAEVLDWMFAELGVVRRASIVDRASMAVDATSWIGNPKAEKVSLARIKKLIQRKHIVLEIATPAMFRRDEDKALWNLFGVEKDDTEASVALIDRLVSAGLKGTTVKLHKALAPHASRLEAAGYLVAKSIKTIEDLVDAAGPAYMEAHPTALMKKVVELKKKAGEPVTFLPASMTAVEAIAATLKG